MWLWLAGWLFNPALALGGAAVASPILIHLLSRRRFRVVRWAAMDFLLAAYRRNRRRVRMEQWLLLAIRCLIVLLFALMVARPFIRPAGAAALLAGWGAGPQTERIVLLDDSYSMGYDVGGGRTVFQRACVAVEQLAVWIAAEFPGDRLTLIRTSRPREAASALVRMSPDQLDLLRRRIGDLRVTDGSPSMREAIRAAADLIENAPTQANTTVYVVSDFQRVDWTASEPALRPETETSPSVIAPLAAAAARRPARLCLVDVGADHPENLAVTDLRIETRRAVAGVRTRLEVTVANHSDASVSDAELSIALAEQALPPVLLPPIEPRAVIRERVELTFPREGGDRVVVDAARSGAPDRLPLDNRRALGVRVSSAVSILLVNGEPAVDPYRDEVYLLRTALAPAGPVSSGNDVRVIEESEFEAATWVPQDAGRSFAGRSDGAARGRFWPGADLVVLANVHRLSDATLERLTQFVSGGGGLLIFLGDQVDADDYNERLYARGAGLLPAELLGITSATDPQGATIDRIDAAHPLLRPLAQGAGNLLRGAKFYRYYSAKPAELASSLPAAAGRPIDPARDETHDPSAEARGAAPVAAGDSLRRGAARILVSLNEPPIEVEGRTCEPALLVHRRFGAGEVALCATSADLEWNGWARDPTYVAVMLRLAGELARRSTHVGALAVGGSIDVPVDLREYEPRATLRPPNWPSEPEYDLEARRNPSPAADKADDVPGTGPAGETPADRPPSSPDQASTKQGAPGGIVQGADVGRYVVDHAGRAGVCEMRLRRSTGAIESRFFAVNPDPRESGLARASRAELAAALPEMPFEYVREIAALSRGAEDSRRELWWPILAAVAALLMAEQALAWWFGARGVAPRKA